MAILGSSAAIKEGFLPLSLVPRDVLSDILLQVLLQTHSKIGRNLLSIPIENVMSYYETELVSKVISTDFGLLFTLCIPFSSESTAQTYATLFHYPCHQTNH